MRYHQGNDSWGRGSYKIPKFAVAGCSYTGEWSDSPATENQVKAETKRLRDHLRKNGITRTRLSSTQTGNVFCAKIWVNVPGDQYEKAQAIADAWLTVHDRELDLLHDAY